MFRRNATIEVDGSLLFNKDMSALRGIVRADVVHPNPAAICRVSGIVPA